MASAPTPINPPPLIGYATTAWGLNHVCVSGTQGSVYVNETPNGRVIVASSAAVLSRAQAADAGRLPAEGRR